MHIIDRKSSHPYFNIAAEEYLIKTMEEPCFMLWQNSASVIIGKHQNPLREVNLEYLNTHHIPIIRRISGGGTVYHDLGNLNYSFIDMGKSQSLVNFAKYSKPIIDLLQQLNVNAQLVGKSDLKIEGKKFSGNASHVYKNKILHHGTLLFNSDLNILNTSIKISNTNINDKAVSSNRSIVTNISDYLNPLMSIDVFKGKLLEYIISIFPEAKMTSLSEEQEYEIEKLAREKYSTWEWNFGYSPKYQVLSSVHIQNNEIEFNTKVNKGFIQDIEYKGLIPEELNLAMQTVIDKQHQKQVVHHALSQGFSKSIIEYMNRILF